MVSGIEQREARKGIVISATWLILWPRFFMCGQILLNEQPGPEPPVPTPSDPLPPEPQPAEPPPDIHPVPKLPDERARNMLEGRTDVKPQ
jgi:hypothetical protein